MSATASVTVIAPLHNAEEYLDDFFVRISSTLRVQDSLVVIDDGSSDSTAAKILSWAEGRPGVRAVVNTENIGVAATRNRALALADTDYVWFVDHDDIWKSDILERLVSSADDADIVICRAEYRTVEAQPGRIVDGIDNHSRLSGDDALELMLTGRVHGYLWTKLIRRELLGVDPFPLLSSQSDFVGVARAMAKARAVVTIPDTLYYYLRREGSITRHKEPHLENHAAARDAMLESLETSRLSDKMGLADYFRSWFYAHAVAFVPVRSHASTRLKREGERLARAELATVSLQGLYRRNKRVAAEMTAIKYGGVLYSPLIRLLLVAHDGLRAIRGRLRSEQQPS